jgi:hypothetical protein
MESSREYVASYPHGVLAMRIAGNQNGKVNAKVAIRRTTSVQARTSSANNDNVVGNNTVNMRAGSGIIFTAEARVVPDGGGS